MTAYEELRTGFTAAVSHELRTPLARLLSLLEMATLPGEDIHALVDRARDEVESARELIDEVLFLSELESGGRVVSLGPVPVRPELDVAVAELEERASRAGVSLAVEGDAEIELEMRPRMLRVIAPEPGRERDPLRRPGRLVHARDRARRQQRRPPRHRRRRRRQRGGARAPLRALLPRRPRPRLARHGPRARDREAHRRPGGRHRRGAGGKGAGLEIRCVFPAGSRCATVHQFLTTRSPARHPTRRSARGDTRSRVHEHDDASHRLRQARRARRHTGRPRRRDGVRRERPHRQLLGQRRAQGRRPRRSRRTSSRRSSARRAAARARSSAASTG